jgi:4-oxalocrotonate tautomerase
MPYLNIKFSGATLSPQQMQALFSHLTDMMAKIMKKSREVTVVSIDVTDRQHWSVAGRGLTHADRPAAFVDIKITAGTNSSEEKAAMIAGTTAVLKEIIGKIQMASYVVIHEIAADSCGYDGMTQASRQQISPVLRAGFSRYYFSAFRYLGLTLSRKDIR